jgi:hypothetical protein
MPDANTPDAKTTDWKLLAQARGLNLSESDLGRIAPLLESLESAFRPLTRLIPHEVEPATVLSDAAVAGG